MQHYHYSLAPDEVIKEVKYITETLNIKALYFKTNKNRELKIPAE